MFNFSLLAILRVCFHRHHQKVQVACMILATGMRSITWIMVATVAEESHLVQAEVAGTEICLIKPHVTLQLLSVHV